MSKRAQAVIWLIGVVAALALLTAIAVSGDMVPGWVLGVIVLVCFGAAFAWVVWRYRDFDYGAATSGAQRGHPASSWILAVVPVAFLASPLRDEWLMFVTGSTSALAGVIAGIALEHRPPDQDGRPRADPTQG